MACGCLGGVSCCVRIVVGGIVEGLACGIVARGCIGVVAGGSCLRAFERDAERDVRDVVDGCEQEAACRLEARAAGDRGGDSCRACRLHARACTEGAVMPDVSTKTVPRTADRQEHVDRAATELDHQDAGDRAGRARAPRPAIVRWARDARTMVHRTQGR